MELALTAPVQRNAISPRAGWLLVLVTLIGAYIILPMYLVCACPIGVVKGNVAMAILAAVLVRTIVGVIANRPGRVWLFYIALVISLRWLVPGMVAFSG